MKPFKERQGSEIDHIALHLQFTIPYFKDFTRSLISQLVERLVGISFKKGDTLIRQGDVGDSLYIIYAGNTKPWVVRFSNRLELFNEFTNIITCYHMMLFSDIYLNYEVRYSIIGVSLAVCTYFVIAFNTCIVIQRVV